MPRMMNLSIINSDPILCDYRPAYGYHCCCSILTMSHPTNEIYGGFGQYCYACFVLMYIITAFPYVITTEWILCLISTACWLKRHEILLQLWHIFGVQMISIIVRLWQILFDMVTILFDYGCIKYDYIISHLIRFTV